jgi:hypothetical protein
MQIQQTLLQHRFVQHGFDYTHENKCEEVFAEHGKFNKMWSDFQELTNTKLEVLMVSNEINDDNAEEEEPAKPTLTAKAISNFLRKADKLAEMGVNMDPITERSFEFKRTC